MSDPLAALRHVRYVLFGDESGPGLNAPCIGDTLWADNGTTLLEYIDQTIERASTKEMELVGGGAMRLHVFEGHAKYPQFCAHCGYPPGTALKHFAQTDGPKQDSGTGAK